MLRFYNGKTLTMAEGCAVTDDEVWVEEDKIAYVGPTPDALPAFDRQVDLRGGLLTPLTAGLSLRTGLLAALCVSVPELRSRLTPLTTCLRLRTGLLAAL